MSASHPKGSKFNPRIKEMHSSKIPDVLYHLGLDTGMNLSLLKNLKFVVMSGSPSRAEWLAYKFAEENQGEEGRGQVLRLGKTERYSLFLVDSVLSVSHGMGAPSASILLHELFKLCHAVGVLDTVKFIRLGTCGGIGIEAGTVVVTEEALNSELERGWRSVALGKSTLHPSIADPSLVSGLMEAGKEAGIEVARGKTVTTDDFYEGQGRLDGAFDPWYSEPDKQAFLERLAEMGVRNMEMECGAVLAFCKRAGVPAACLAVALLNRVEGDQVHLSKDKLMSVTNNALKVVCQFLKKELKNHQGLGLPPKVQEKA